MEPKDKPSKESMIIDGQYWFKIVDLHLRRLEGANTPEASQEMLFLCKIRNSIEGILKGANYLRDSQVEEMIGSQKARLLQWFWSQN